MMVIISAIILKTIKINLIIGQKFEQKYPS